jgi:hypothetical protein
MKRQLTLTVPALLPLVLGGCAVVEGIFKVGFWAGAILIVGVLMLVWFLTRMFR